MSGSLLRLALVALVTAAAGGTTASLIVSAPASGQVGGPGTTTETTPTRPTETTPTDTTPTTTTPPAPTTTAPPPPGTTDPPAQTLPVPPKTGRSIDDLFAGVAQAVPAFAGMYLDTDRHRMVVRVVGGRRADAARAARLLRPALRSLGPLGKLRVQGAGYSFKALRRTYAILTRADALEHEDVVSSDIDERANRLTFGVTSDTGAGMLAGKARTAGVDPAMVRTKRVAPERPESLTDKDRPVVGGLSIYDDGACTVFPAVRYDANNKPVTGYVTASHCGNRWRNGDPQPAAATYYQPTKLAENKIGPENHNPRYYTGFDGCKVSEGWYCRYSDTLFIKKDPPNTVWSLGYIARPYTELTTDWDGVSKFRVVGVVDFPAVGYNIIKVGQSTGLTHGKVTATCETVDVQQTSPTRKWRYFCQAKSSYYSQEGDSGAPVFGLVNKPRQYDVKMIGVHGGGGGRFSSIGTYNTQDPDWELGPLKLCAASAPVAC